jgi:hypothetical protein
MARLPAPGGDDGTWGTILNQYLQVEHDTDGTHLVDYLPLAGGTLAGTVDVNNNVLSQAEMKDYSETVITANSTSTYAVNLATGNVFELTLTATCTITFTNPPASGKSGSVTLILTQDGVGGRTISWPASVKWPGGIAPTLSVSSASVDIIQLVTTNAGTTWRGFIAGTNFS